MSHNFSQSVHVTLAPGTTLGEALRVFDQTGADSLAVLDRGKYVGAVNKLDMARYAPSPATTLSKWEMGYLLEEVTLQSEKLVRAVPVVEFKWDPRHKLEALLNADAGAVAVMSDGQFSHLESWQELCKLMLDAPQRETTKQRELVQPKEFALSV